MSNCYHCGLPVPANTYWQLEINQQHQSFCCPGCLCVCQMIQDSGLNNYYQYRKALAPKTQGVNLSDSFQGNTLSANLEQELALFDHPAHQKEFIRRHSDQSYTAQLVIEGIQCAACSWLIEHKLKQIPAITQASVNLSNHRLTVKTDQTNLPVSHIFKAIYQIGYKAFPYHPDQTEALFQKESRKMLQRLGVAGLGVMQVMMLAVALYAGDASGIEQEHQTLLRWVSIIFTTPVAFFSAFPFYQSAWRSLLVKRLNMDVPVSIAILGAYFASVAITYQHGPEVYFDSVCMFTFFLLTSRYLELRARQRLSQASNALIKLLPATVTQIEESGASKRAPLEQICAGDQLLIKAGETIPVDGHILVGTTYVDESSLTGEFLPKSKQPGDTVTAGTTNGEGPIHVVVKQVGESSTIANILRLMDQAQSTKPLITQIADRIASYFVSTVLLIATMVAWFWLETDPQNAFPITLSVLVATCPCALSLATPAALTAATGFLREKGFLITQGDTLAKLARIQTCIFDKTGTLTLAQLEVKAFQLVKLNQQASQVLSWVEQLEARSEHPIAQALVEYCQQYQAKASHQLSEKTWKAMPGQGIEGTFTNSTQQQIQVRIGKRDFVSPFVNPEAQNQISKQSVELQQIFIASDQGDIAFFEIADRLRPEAQSTIEALNQLGIQSVLLTGDTQARAKKLAESIGIQEFQGDMTPQDKLAYLNLRHDKDALAMIGDGVNDAPSLAGAHLSIAMGEGTDLAKTTADAVLLSNHLPDLRQALLHAKSTQSIVRQNIIWALSYNICVLPLAAAGMLAPYAAAIGMSLSSLVVVGNGLRLARLANTK